MSRGRPVGYFLWGVAWLLISGMVLAMPLVIIYARLNGVLVESGMRSVLLAWVLGVPLCAWLFVVFPFAMVSQALMGFVASNLATREKYRDTQIVEFVGGARRRLMEARVDTPAMRVLTAVGAVGIVPGWVFAISAMVVVAGIGVVLSASSSVAALAGVAVLTVGAGGAAVGIRTRVNQELKKPPPGPVDKYGLTDKYYKGLAYREGKRAGDLQKARDAGRAGDITTWGKAEAEHALRTYGSAAYAARKGVRGALDAAFADVFEAMDGAVTRQQAEQLVIDAAAYRGKKPVPVRSPDALA